MFKSSAPPAFQRALVKDIRAGVCPFAPVELVVCEPVFRVSESGGRILAGGFAEDKNRPMSGVMRTHETGGNHLGTKRFPCEQRLPTVGRGVGRGSYDGFASK